ncbi:MAG: hypothetical protein KDD41_08595 [Flavobacteriales bacterium]|nr:hypothetical protein [Flavobacteriales bacterium]
MLGIFKKKQYIFCINTGRAGSEYLANILSTANSVWADHEPEPQMIGKYLNLVTEKEYAETYAQREFKVAEIRKIIRSSFKTNYIETNHMFIKTFYDVVIKKLKPVKVVFLKRNLVDTLHSFYQLGYFSDRNEAWKEWMISPYAKTAALPCLLREEEKDDVGLSLAYLLDIYYRGYRFMEEYPEIPVIEVALEDLNDRDKVLELFHFLNLKPTAGTYDLIGQRKNNRSERKKQIGSKEISRDYLVERTNTYIDKLEAQGYKIRDKVIL